MDSNFKENEAVVTETPQKKGFDFVSIFSQPLFLTICILVSISFASYFLSFVSYSASYSASYFVAYYVSYFVSSFIANIMLLLFTISLWTTFAKAKSNSSPISGMKFTSGIIMAQYVITYVNVGCFFFCGIMCTAFCGRLAKSGLVDLIEDALVAINGVGLGSLDPRLKGIVFVVFFIILGIACIVAAVEALLINIFYTRKAHMFAKSLCESEISNDDLVKKASAIKNWLMVIGILGAVSSLSLLGISNPLGAIAVGTVAAAFIVASIWVKNNFVSGNKTN